MNRLQRFILLGLLIAAVIVIFNCAGYLTITLVFEPPAAGRDVQAGMPLRGIVVSYATATPVGPDPTAQSSTLADVIPTPLPLLPTVTPLPPAAPAAAATPPAEPTASPPPNRPAATAIPGDLEVISHQSYVDSLGWYHIVGEVRNNANMPMEYVEVMAKLYDADEEVIGTKLTFTAPDTIFPGGAAPFDIIALRQSQWRDIAFYALQVKGDVAIDSTPQNLILVSQNSNVRDGLLLVSGEVQNIGQKPALAKLIVTLYDAEHNVINTAWGYANAGIIDSDQVSKFEIKIDHQTDPDNFHYRLQIEEETIDSDSK